MPKDLAIHERTTDLLSASAENEIKQMSFKLMRLASGNRRLNERQATELAIYCWMTQLNPYNNEAYYLPDVGIIPGVSGVRRKANEYLAMVSADPNDRFFVKFREAAPGEAVFDIEKGDIAQHATVTIRSYSDKWRGELLRMFTEFKSAGMKVELAYQRAEMLAGDEPVWTSVAVVDHRESFERAPGTKGEKDKGTHDKWDRVERAKKRAEKWAIRKAFPTVILPDAELGESSQIDAEVIEGIVRDVKAELAEPPREENVILAELGFGDDEPEPEQKPEPEPEVERKSKLPTRNGKSWGKDYVDALIEAKPQIAKNAPNAVAILNLLNPASLDKAVQLGGLYREWRETGIDSKGAAKLTLDGKTPE